MTNKSLPGDLLRNSLVVLPVLFLTILSLYAPVVHYDLCWDDVGFSIENPLYQQDLTPAQFWKTQFFQQNIGMLRPLQALLFYIDFQLHGFSATWMHFENLLFLFFLLWGLFLLLCRASSAKLVPFGATLLYLLLPIQVESIAFISGRDSLLGVAFMIWSLLALDKALVNPPDRQHIWTLVAALFFILGCTIKESALMTFPLGLAWGVCLRPHVSFRKRFVPWVVLGCIPILYLILRNFFGVTPPEGQHLFLGGNGFRQFMTFPPLILAYLKNILFPWQLNIYYPFPDNPFALNSTFVTGLTLILLLILGMCLAWKRNRCLVFAGALFFTGLFPVMHIFNIHKYMTDRWANTASLGVVLALAIGLQTLWGKNRCAAAALWISLCLFYGCQTHRQIPIWQNDMILFDYAVQCEPKYYQGHFNLGNGWYQLGDLEAARHSYLKALQIKTNYAPALTNLGYIAYQQKQYVEAYEYFQKALQEDNEYASAGLEITRQALKQNPQESRPAS